MVSTPLVSAIQTNIINTKFTYTFELVPLPAVSWPTQTIISNITTDAISSGQYPSRRGTRQNTHSD